MSDSQGLQSELDFWEFVGCSRCQLPFVSQPGVQPQVPFWLTECGHVLCNNHLNPDQSCAQCGAHGIQLVPLQRDMDPPMSDWFHSLPHTLDGVASAAKFQHEVMSFQIRHYKARYQQARELIDRIKREAAENKVLKKTIEELRRENDQLRQHLGFVDNSQQHGRGVGEHSDIRNSNKKRRLTDQPRTASSPRSINSTLGPSRLTLPPGQQPPNLTSRQESNDGSDSRGNISGNHGNGANEHQALQRPGSSRFIEIPKQSQTDHRRQYMYVPPQTPQFFPQQLSHEQSAPIRQSHRTRPDQDQAETHQATKPPGSLTRFKPAQTRRLMASQQGNTVPALNHRPQVQNQPGANGDRRRMDMAPPPIPGHQTLKLPSNQGPTSFTTDMQYNAPPQSSRRNTSALPESNRFVPTANGQRFLPHVDSQRFVPPAPSGSSGPQRFVAAPAAVSGSRAPSRAANFSIPAMSGGQRTPFIPGNFG